MPKKLPLFIITFLYLVYSAIYIFQTSFIFHTKRYFVLFDDMMISMQYAKNFAHGLGLVWNKGGEHVEGYTNFLWTLYMSFWHLFPIPLSKTSLAIQISGVAFLTINLYIVKKIVDNLITHSYFTSLIAVIFTATYFPLNSWAVVGTEVSVLTLALNLALLLSIKIVKTKKFDFFVYIIFGCTSLIRTDAIIPIIVLFLWLVYKDNENRKKHIMIGLPIWLVFLLGQEIFRIWYYHDILPNTYYLKMTGYPLLLRITRGIYITFQFIWNFNWLLFTLPFLLIFKIKKNVFLLPIIALISTQLIYNIYVGGDAWEYIGGSNRYVSIIMPLFFILLSLSIDELISVLSIHFKKKLTYGVIGIFMLAAIFNVNYIPNTQALHRWLLLIEPGNVASLKYNVKLSDIINKISDKNAKIAVVWAGTMPYFTNREYIDLLGKNNKVVAHGKMIVYPDKYTTFHPGHMKWNYTYSIGELKPDLIIQIWGTSYNDIKPYLDKYYKKVVIDNVELFVRKDSTHIHQQ